jgi:hypothetical protein
VIQDPRKPGPNGPNTYFLPDAFAPGQLGHFGNSNRQFFHGPGISNTDMGLSKRTMIRETMGFEVRAEFFNIFNHAQFNNPGGSLGCQIITDPNCTTNFGVVTSTRARGREGQFGAKFFW